MINLIIATIFLFGAQIGPRLAEIPHEIIEELDLTDAQQQEIETLLRSTEAKMIKFRADIETKRLDLRSELEKDSPNETTVRKLVQEIGDIQTNMKIVGLETAIKIKKILGPEKIKEAKKLMRARIKERFHNRRFGPGFGRSPEPPGAGLE